MAAVSVAHAQTFPTTGSQYIWKVGDGTYSDWAANYSFNNGSPTSAPNAFRDVIFGWEGTPPSAVISLDPLVTATGSTFPSNGSARSFNIYVGDYTFDFNGSTATIPWSNKIWRFGNGEGNTPTVHFTDSTNADQSIVFANLVIGDNGSSDNVWGGEDATITFNPNVTHSLTAAGTLTVGSTAGGGGNEFNVLAGQNITRGAITVNAGEGNKILVSSGGTLTTSAATAIGAGAALIVEGENSLFSKTGGTDVAISGEMTVRDQASASVFTGITMSVLSGGAISVDGTNSQFIHTTFANTSANSGIKTLDLAGRLESVNGATFDSQAQLRITSADAVVKVDKDSTLVVNTQTINQAAFGLNMNVDSSGNTTSKLTIEGGGELYAQGGLNLSKGLQFGYFAGEVLVETRDGSTLRVDSLAFDARGNSNGRNYIPVQGKVILGTGGFRVTDNNTDSATVRIGVGTHLELDGGTYGLGFGTNSAGGRLEVKSGGILSGHGVLNLGSLVLDGGTLEVGREGGLIEPASLQVSSLALNSTSTIVFDLFGGGISDQLIVNGSFGSPLEWVIVATAAEGWDVQWTLGEEYNLVSSPNISSNGTYTFALPDLGSEYSWDTSQFGTTGSIFVADAVPEPSTVGLIGIGLAAALWRMRRRPTSVV